MTAYYDIYADGPKPDWYAAAVSAHASYTTTDVGLSEWLTAWRAAVEHERAITKTGLDREALMRVLGKVCDSVWGELVGNCDLTITEFMERSESLMRSRVNEAIDRTIDSVDVYATDNTVGYTWNARFTITPGLALTITNYRSPLTHGGEYGDGEG